ncbi:MAG: hypothetical protein KDD21_05200 [Bacteroidetes bacterium]|nr:hypothetical protein [Bacteroidota bacterium]
MFDIIKVLFQWKKQILWFTIIAIIVSIIITMPFIMPPYYKSTQIFYLSNPQSTDRAALFNEKEGGGVGIFGGKEDVNRFLSILTSEQAAIELIQQFHLQKHYKIEAENKALEMFYTKREFAGNFKAIRNDLGALEVSILDTDAKMAADMVQYIVAYSDSVYRNLLTENKAIILGLLDKQIEEKKASLTGDTSVEELQKLTLIRDQYKISSSNTFKTIYIVEQATPAIKKTKPVRWMLVLGTAIGAFVLAALLAILLDLYKNADKYGFKNS